MALNCTAELVGFNPAKTDSAGSIGLGAAFLVGMVVSFVPQIVKITRRRSARGISLVFVSSLRHPVSTLFTQISRSNPHLLFIGTCPPMRTPCNNGNRVGTDGGVRHNGVQARVQPLVGMPLVSMPAVTMRRSQVPPSPIHKVPCLEMLPSPMKVSEPMTRIRGQAVCSASMGTSNLTGAAVLQRAKFECCDAWGFKQCNDQMVPLYSLGVQALCVTTVFLLVAW